VADAEELPTLRSPKTGGWEGRLTLIVASRKRLRSHNLEESQVSSGIPYDTLRTHDVTRREQQPLVVLSLEFLLGFGNAMSAGE
jgi:hypothetical protein